MPSAGPTPSPLIRALVRTLLALCCISAVLSASAVTDASACGAPGALARRHLPTACHRITRLELDFLNDDLDVPQAFKVNGGAVAPGGVAEFKVYAATDDPRFYYNVSHEFRAIKFRLRGFGDGRRVRYRDDDRNPRWVLEPRPRMRGRTGSIECWYDCLPMNAKYTTRFILTARGYG